MQSTYFRGSYTLLSVDNLALPYYNIQVYTEIDAEEEEYIPVPAKREAGWCEASRQGLEGSF